MRREGQQTIDSVEVVAVTELTSPSCKSLPRGFVGCERGEVGTHTGSSEGHQGLEMRNLALQLGKSRETSLFAIDVLCQVGPLIEQIPASRSGEGSRFLAALG